jgi:hypothetical protein
MTDRFDTMAVHYFRHVSSEKTMQAVSIQLAVLFLKSDSPVG